MAATPSEAIADRLTVGADQVIALVGTRVYPAKPTQDPAGAHVVFTITAGGEGTTLGGRNGLQVYDVLVDCVANTAAAAESLLKVVIERLAGPPVWRDRDNGIHGCFGSADHSEQVLDDGGQVSSQTFRLWFKAP